MSDPAIQAAQRAHARMVDGINTPSRERERITAAREALEPIRDWAAKWSIELLHHDLGQAWAELAPLIFTSEEL